MQVHVRFCLQWDAALVGVLFINALQEARVVCSAVLMYVWRRLRQDVEAQKQDEEISPPLSLLRRGEMDVIL